MEKMNKRNCLKSTILISKLKNAYNIFKTHLESASSTSHNELKQEAQDIKALIKEARREIISPVKPFLLELRKPETIKKIKEIATKPKDDSQVKLPEEEFRLISDLFSNLPNDLVVNDEDYQLFLSYIGSQTDCMKTYDEIAKDNNCNVVNLINSVFLNKFMDNNTVLNVNHLPERLLYYGFGSYLERGTIKLTETVRGLGHGAKNTTFIADKTLDHPAAYAENCHFLIGDISGGVEYLGADTRIDCKNLYGPIQNCSEPAVISIQDTLIGKIESSCNSLTIFCDHVMGSVSNDSIGNTFVINQIDERVWFGQNTGVTFLNKHSYESRDSQFASKFYHYDNSDHSYRSLMSDETDPKVVINLDDLEKEIDISEKGIAIIEDYSNFADDESPSESQSDGILILRQLDDRFPIGAYTSGGVIIIDIPGLSQKEAKQKISPHRIGGLILMRVPDEIDPNKTKLIDLENNAPIMPKEEE